MSDPTFMTAEVLRGVLAEFQWPAPYELDDEDLPDGIVVKFPKCGLFFMGGYLSDMSVAFTSDGTGLPDTVTLSQIGSALGGFPTPNLIKDFSGKPTLKKVQNQLRDLCSVLLTHFKSSFVGDFTWVEPYKAYLERQQQSRA